MGSNSKHVLNPWKSVAQWSGGWQKSAHWDE
jgi:hypothetical protein